MLCTIASSFLVPPPAVSPQHRVIMNVAARPETNGANRTR
jgi:hypothetical protein